MCEDRTVPKVAFHNHGWDFLPHFENGDKNYIQGKTIHDLKRPEIVQILIVPLLNTLFNVISIS